MMDLKRGLGKATMQKGLGGLGGRVVRPPPPPPGEPGPPLARDGGAGRARAGAPGGAGAGAPPPAAVVVCHGVPIPLDAPLLEVCVREPVLPTP